MYVFMAKQNKGQISEDESDLLISPCFEIDASAKLRDIPTNGHEYLIKVMSERKKCRSITKYSKDISEFAKNQSCFIDGIPVIKSSPDAIKPTAQWQEIQIYNFSEVRKFVSRERLKLKPSYKIAKISNIDFYTEPPKLSKVLVYHQKQVNKGLNILSTMVKAKDELTISKEVGVWIYSLLACLHMPCLADTISTLRDIARRCAAIRSQISIEHESAQELAAPLNLIICLVARYFRQIDLADTDGPDE